MDDLGRSTLYVYSGLQGLSRVIEPDGRTWTIERTGDERIKKIINPLGEAHTFERDLAGRVVGEKTFDGRAMRYERDAAGRVIRIAYPDATERSFSYDRAGRLVHDATGEDTRTFAYDPMGRLTSRGARGARPARRDPASSAMPSDDFVGETRGDRRVRNELDTSGRCTRRVLPNGASTRFAYDASDACSSRSTTTGFKLDLARDSLGRETERTAGVGLRIASGYDQRDRLVVRRATAPSPEGSVPQVLSDRRWSLPIASGAWSASTTRAGGRRATRTTWSTGCWRARTGPRRGGFRLRRRRVRSIVAALQELDGARREATSDSGPAIAFRARATRPTRTTSEDAVSAR